MNNLRIGYAEQLINPPLGIPIAGYYVPRYAKGFLDDIKVISLSIKSKNDTVILLSYDCCHIKADMVKKIKAAVSEKTGVAEGNVIVTVTHTHTGPCVEVNCGFECDTKMVSDYIDFAIKQGAIAAEESIKDLKSAKMGYWVGQAPDRIAYIRRYKMKDGSTMTCPPINNPDIDHPIGTLDQRVNVVRFDREGAESVIILNYGIHADTINGEMLASDWVGWTQRTLAKCLDGAKCVCVMGAQGDVGSTHVFPTKSDMNDTEISFPELAGSSTGTGSAAETSSSAGGAPRAGQATSAPEPSTHTTVPPASRAAACAAWSQPTAPPDTTGRPWSAAQAPKSLAQPMP